MDPALATNFSAPASTTLADWHPVIVNEWPNDTGYIASAYEPITLGVSSSDLIDAWTVPPIANGYWQLRSGMIVAVTAGYATDDLPQQHSGIGVSMPCTTSFAFSFNMGLMQSPFFSMTRYYGQFELLDVELIVSPKTRKTTPWGPMLVDNGLADNLEGSAPIAGAIYPEATTGGAQVVLRSGMADFKTRCWHVHMPRRFQRARVILSQPSGDGFGPSAGLWWENWYNWNYAGQTDQTLDLRPDDYLRRSRLAKPVKDGLRVKRRFLQGYVLNYPNNTEQIVANPATAPFISGRGLGLGGEPLPPIPIIGNGYYPEWFSTTPSGTEKGGQPFIFPCNVPMAEFVVDTNEWPGNYIPRSSVNNAPATTPFPQDFTGQVTTIPGQASYAPIQMCPPMEWDVTYVVRVKFSGAPNAGATRLGQS